MDEFKRDFIELAPAMLEGNVVRLERMRAEHVQPLWEASAEGREETFRWFPWPMSTQEDFRWYVVDKVLAEETKGLSVGFVNVEKESGQIIGSTRFLNLDPANRRVEIGSTWVVPARQRTAVNTEAKYLMLRHAFEHWHCVRVELKTDGLNQRSRNAILRIGAKEEGTLRRHIICWDGRVRDTVYFSILDTEWPAAKANLEARLGHPQKQGDPAALAPG